MPDEKTRKNFAKAKKLLEASALLKATSDRLIAKKTVPNKNTRDSARPYFSHLKPCQKEFQPSPQGEIIEPTV